MSGSSSGGDYRHSPGAAQAVQLSELQGIQLTQRKQIGEQQKRIRLLGGAVSTMGCLLVFTSLLSFVGYVETSARNELISQLYERLQNTTETVLQLRLERDNHEKAALLHGHDGPTIPANDLDAWKCTTEAWGQLCTNHFWECSYRSNGSYYCMKWEQQ